MGFPKEVAFEQSPEGDEQSPEGDEEGSQVNS
jgi:hypothetical protein